MLEQVLGYLKNWFLVPNGIYKGDFRIVNGSIDLPFLQEKQYFRVFGSVFNDGVHQYPVKDLLDEEFEGVVWALAVPQPVIELTAEIAQWQEKNGQGATSPYQSESFGGYSYTKATDAVTGGGVTWQTVFRDRLNRWRKI